MHTRWWHTPSYTPAMIFYYLWWNAPSSAPQCFPAICIPLFTPHLPSCCSRPFVVPYKWLLLHLSAPSTRRSTPFLFPLLKTSLPGLGLEIPSSQRASLTLPLSALLIQGSLIIMTLSPPRRSQYMIFWYPIYCDLHEGGHHKESPQEITGQNSIWIRMQIFQHNTSKLIWTAH